MYNVLDGLKKSTRSSWLRFFCAGIIYVLIFCYPWHTQKNWQGHDYFLQPDTASYMYFGEWSDPWHSYRSIGYRAFLYPFLHHEHQKFLNAIMAAPQEGIDVWAGPEQPLYAIAAEVGIAGKFETIALVQRVTLALAYAVFYLSLCRWFNPLFSFAALLAALWLAPPPNPQFILTEPLSCALTWFCGAFLLNAHKKNTHQTVFFSLACLCASLSFLIRPQTLSLTGVCSLVFLYQVIVWGRKSPATACIKAAAAFFPLLLAYGYIGWLSLTGGHLFLHTNWDIYYSSFFYFADAEDVRHMPTERAKKYAAWYGAHREEFFNNMKNGQGGFRKIHFAQNSPAYIRCAVGDSLVYSGAWQKAEEHFKHEQGIGGLSLLGRSIFGKELNAGLLERHIGEMLVNKWENFIAGFGYYYDVWYLRHMSRATFAINMLALLLSISAVMISIKSGWPIIIMAGIHVMAILAAALGHFVVSRYVEPTQAFLLLAGMCSLWILAGRICQRAIALGWVPYPKP